MKISVVVSSVMFTCLVGCGGRHREAVSAPPVRPLVIYLHGMLEENASGEAESARVRERFSQAGFDVFSPKGRPGLCDWSDEAKRSLCWPSDGRALAAASDIVQSWAPALATNRPVVVVGFSNGGAFSVLLAVHGLVPACGFATMHGFPAGTLRIGAAPQAPLLLLAGKGAAWEKTSSPQRPSN